MGIGIQLLPKEEGQAIARTAIGFINLQFAAPRAPGVKSQGCHFCIALLQCVITDGSWCGVHMTHSVKLGPRVTIEPDTPEKCDPAEPPDVVVADDSSPHCCILVVHQACPRLEALRPLAHPTGATPPERQPERQP